MIPSLVLVRSNKKRLVALTLKRSLKIGTHEDSDIIVNNPHLYKTPQILGPGSTPGETSPGQILPEDKAKRFSLPPVYTFSIDGLNVRMISLKVFISVLFIACISIVATTSFLTGPSASSITQDWTPIILPAEGVYGFCRQDRKHGEGVRFSFEAEKSQTYKLAFVTGGKGDGTSIKLSLNGTVISEPLALPAGWGEETFVPLPSANMKDGNNIVEVRPASIAPSSTSWGISEVRVLSAGRSNTRSRGIAIHERKMILDALDRRDISGQELAHHYETVSLWGPSTSSGSSFLDRHSIMEKIEQRMRKKLHQVAFDIRSENILGNESMVQQLLDETRNWIPGDWLEGWEIYNEIIR